LRRTHDARIHDIAFDGKTLVLDSESWVGTDPIEPSAGEKHLIPAAAPGPPTLADFMEEEILHLKIALPHVIIETDGHILRFTCKSFGVKRFAPAKEDYR
jgi:hypothetical protein